MIGGPTFAPWGGQPHDRPYPIPLMKRSSRLTDLGSHSEAMDHPTICQPHPGPMGVIVPFLDEEEREIARLSGGQTTLSVLEGWSDPHSGAVLAAHVLLITRWARNPLPSLKNGARWQDFCHE